MIDKNTGYVLISPLPLYSVIYHYTMMMLMEYLKIRKTRTPKLKPWDLMEYGLCGLFLAVSSLLRKLSIFTPNIIRFKVLNYNINIKLITNIHLNNFFLLFGLTKEKIGSANIFFRPGNRRSNQKGNMYLSWKIICN